MVIRVGRQEASISRAGNNEKVGRERVLPCDPGDWPIVSVDLLLDFPIWTENQDFFGSGVATWTTDRVELYLKGE